MAVVHGVRYACSNSVSFVFHSYVSFLYLPTCAASLDFGSQAVEVGGFFFLQIILKQQS